MKQPSREEIEAGLAPLDKRLHLINMKNGACWNRHLHGISPSELAEKLLKLDGNPVITIRADPKVTTHHMPELAMEIKSPGHYHLHIIIHPGELHLEHLEVAPGKHGQGTAKKLLAWVVDLAAHVPVLASEDKTVRLTTIAGLRNGAYSWARFGFTPYVDTNPELDSWAQLKKTIQRARLNQDASRIVYDVDEVESCDFNVESPYMKNYSKGFQLTADEQAVIKAALASDDPKALWVISDLGRVLAQPSPSAQPVTVGKAILCGLSWGGELRLDPREAGYQRLAAYLAPLIAQSQQKGNGRGI